MTIKPEAKPHMTTSTDIIAMKASIDALIKSFADFRVEVATNNGANSTELRHIQESVKALDGLFSRVSNLERSFAVLDEGSKTFDKLVREWREESIRDRGALKSEIEVERQRVDKLDNYKWFALGGIGMLQFALTVFGPSLRHVFGLP